jgi:Tol biopolymer transport system component
VVQYEDPADTGEVLSGLLPVECLERPQASCKPTAILDSVVAGSRSWEAAYWSPDGRRLATVDYSACATDFHETKLWIYDLETQGSHLVGDYPNQCLEPGPGPWTADGSRFMLIDYGTSDDYRIWLASVATGSLTRVAASSGGIIGVTGFFQVP